MGRWALWGGQRKLCRALPEFIVHGQKLLKVSSQFLVVFIVFSTADNCFGLLVLISTVRGTKTSLKNYRITAANRPVEF